MADFSLNLGKISGIQIQLHWTFILLLLFAVLLGPVIFLFIVALFILVVIHEMAHSITSKRNGIEVKRIVLLPLGGASIVNLEQASPEVALRIALAGPITSILLALIFGALSVYAPAGWIKEALQLLFEINILLGVFNLLPAFPLDGGRVLKSYLEEKRDQLSATKLAVKISNITLVLFIFGSTAYVLLIPGASLLEIEFLVIWNIIVVIFVYGGAQAELESAYVLKYTSGLRVSSAASKSFIVVSPDTKMRQIYQILLKQSGIPIIVQNGAEISILARIAPMPLSKPDPELLTDKVLKYTKPIPKVDRNALLSKAIQKMRFEEAPMIAVTANGKLVGIISANHVESLIALHMRQSVEKKK